MDRTERFYKINELLRAKKAVSFATLLANLGVSRSTLNRNWRYPLIGARTVTRRADWLV